MSQTRQLQRRLGLFDATMLAVGSTIGSGIFFTLSYMAQSVSTPGVLIGLWVFAGLFTMLGAVCYSELAAMFPRTGGQYVFLNEAYSEFWGFLFGWTQFLVIATGFNAAVALAFAKYLGVLAPVFGEANVLLSVPLGDLLPTAAQDFLHCPDCLRSIELNSAQLVACGVIVLLTGVNIRGVREGAFVQNLFTVLKMAALAALIVAGLTLSGRVTEPTGTSHFRPFLPGPEAFQAGFLAGVAVAMSKALFAFDGWSTLTFVAEEVHDSHRTMPRALVLGCLLVTILYLLTNVAYMAVLPVDRIAAADEGRVAQSVADVLFGNVGSILVAIAILVSTFGAVNGLILGGARVFFAMARDGLFFRSCASLSPRGTPTVALVFQGIWSMVLVLTGSYTKLLTYTTFASVFFGGLTVAAVYWLRFRQPERPRPYRCWGYPVTPALYLAICISFLVFVIQGDPQATLIGAALVLTGIPFYLVWRARRTSPETAPPAR